MKIEFLLINKRKKLTKMTTTISTEALEKNRKLTNEG